MIPDRAGWDLRHKADMGTQSGPCNLREGHREQPRKESGLGERPGIKGQGEGGEPVIPAKEVSRESTVCVHSTQRCPFNGLQKR